MQFTAEQINFWVDKSLGDEYEYQNGKPIAYKYSYVGKASVRSGVYLLEIPLTRDEASRIMTIVGEAAQRALDDLTKRNT